jgi:hypothetical protein
MCGVSRCVSSDTTACKQRLRQLKKQLDPCARCEQLGNSGARANSSGDASGKGRRSRVQCHDHDGIGFSSFSQEFVVERRFSIQGLSKQAKQYEFSPNSRNPNNPLRSV